MQDLAREIDSLLEPSEPLGYRLVMHSFPTGEAGNHQLPRGGHVAATDYRLVYRTLASFSVVYIAYGQLTALSP